MKKFNLLLIAILSIAFASTAAASGKRYEIKSGIVTYKVEGGGSMLGISTKTSGTQEMYFKEWGNIEVRKVDEKSTVMGQTTVTKEITKFDHGTVYNVDEERKEIIKSDIAMFQEMDKQGKNLSQAGKDMLKQMGGKKIGTGKVLGYPCEIWEVMGSKIWMYKGVPLKTEANIMGFKHNEIATSAKFNVSVPEKYFKLPPYPVKTVDDLMRESMEGENNTQKQNTNVHQPAPKPQQPSPEQMKQMQDMLQNLGKMFGGQ